MYNGIINVYKEAGFTSFDVVAKMRGILGQRKIGHTGTLDPDATGVLPVVVGNATKLVDMLTDKKKEYVAELKLGVRTDTLDVSGTVLETKDVTCGEEEIRAAIMSFVGDIMQVPPMYSALKVNGQKLCDLAREGKEVERKPRPVTIHEIEIISVDMTGAADGVAADDGRPVIKIRILCSKGTYIRTLCDDIGTKLGCGAVMTSLVRTMSGAYRIEDAHTLTELQSLKDEGRLDEVIVPVDAVFSDLPEYTATGETLRLVRNGNGIAIPGLKDERVRVYDGGNEADNKAFIAVYELRDKKRKIYYPWLMFL